MNTESVRLLCPRSGFGLIALAGSAGALPAYRMILAAVGHDFRSRW